jgi:hypothetical protein
MAVLRFPSSLALAASGAITPIEKTKPIVTAILRT